MESLLTERLYSIGRHYSAQQSKKPFDLVVRKGRRRTGDLTVHALVCGQLSTSAVAEHLYSTTMLDQRGSTS